jgi:hypothetical protein
MLKDNGGPTMTMALLPGSPALNMGDLSQLHMPDQRGVMRSGGVNIGAYQASASAFDVSTPAQATTGAAFDVTVTAVDKFGQVAIGYTGTVRFTSSDPQAMLPADYTFIHSDYGMHTFSSGFTLITLGTQTITATDLSTGITGSAPITVTSQVAQFVVVPASSSVTAGSQFDVTVKAEDSNGNVVPGYLGAVEFSSTDSHPAVLPNEYTFTSGDQGVLATQLGVGSPPIM